MKTRKAWICTLHEDGICDGKQHGKPQHTPTPWHYEIITQNAINIYSENRNDGWVANVGVKASAGVNETNAAFIVRAVNENEQIHNALKSALNDSARLTLENERLKDSHEELLSQLKEVRNSLRAALVDVTAIDKAIAKAEGK